MPCPLCKSVDESVSHFLLQCPVTHGKRPSCLVALKTVLDEANVVLENSSELVDVILDCSSLCPDHGVLSAIEAISRRLIYSLFSALAKLTNQNQSTPYGGAPM